MLNKAWSLLNYLKNIREGFMPYWINSSSNDLIKRLLMKGDKDMKLELQELICCNSINKVIDDTVVMSEVVFNFGGYTHKYDFHCSS
jgi:hypothetical protein